MEHRDHVDPDRQVESLSAVSLAVGFGRIMLAPLVPLVLLAGGVAARLSPGAVALLLILLLVVIGVAVIGLMSPGVVVQGGRLSVPGREERRRAPGGTVDLTRLVSAKSVSYKGGLVSGRGLALFRSLLCLEDADGGQAMFPAWGWSPKTPLQAVLRNAVIASHARMDPMTWARLGFRNDQGDRISWMRRFI
jgi:hypothetical protein